jgi:hypothetical protein
MSLLYLKSNCSDDGYCTFNNINLPYHENRQFYAFSSFYYQFNNTGSLVQSNLTKDLDAFSNATSYICSLNFKQVLFKYNFLNFQILTYIF